MKQLNIILLALALTACTAKAPLSSRLVRSEMVRCPQASYLDGQEGNLKWNYTTGLELKALLDAALATECSPSGQVSGEDAAQANFGHLGQTSGADAAQADFGPYEQEACAASKLDTRAIVKYVDDWYDAIIDSTGTIGGKYKKSNYSSDHICPGKTLFRLYDITGKEKYKLAMDKLYEQICEMPRTPEGGFWHKQIYPEQMWLDGLYMVEPFYAEYTSRYVPDSLKAVNYQDIVKQFTLAWDNCYDPDTRLLRHAWDASHSMFWCDPSTGQSEHAWGRACGWYAMALADVIPWIPEGELQQKLIDMLSQLLLTVREFADPQSRMWYQVLDRPGAEGNYLEASASAMFTYVLLKGTRNGWIKDYSVTASKDRYRRLLKTFVSVDSKGLVNLNRCCEVAGLGGKENRSGTYDYYIHERIRANDPKGIGPLIWASIEYEKL